MITTTTLRWSAFPRSRYIEEAEKFSRPGSVAQKMAFFETYYKEGCRGNSIARAGKRLRVDGPLRSNCKIRVTDESSPQNGLPVNNLNNDNEDSMVIEPLDYDCGEPLQITSKVDVSKSYSESEKKEREKLWKYETSHIDREDGAANMIAEEKTFVENKVNDEPASHLTVSNNCEKVGDAESSGSPEMEKPLLQDFVREEVSEDTYQKKAAVVCSTILRSQKTFSGVATLPAMATLTPLPYWKRNNITPISRNSTVDNFIPRTH